MIQVLTGNFLARENKYTNKSHEADDTLPSGQGGGTAGPNEQDFWSECKT
jgi:hypothetical protein